MKITPYQPVSRTRLQEILNRFPSVRVGVVGDGCVDIYWEADMTKSVLSRETPHYPSSKSGFRLGEEETLRQISKVSVCPACPL